MVKSSLTPQEQARAIEIYNIARTKMGTERRAYLNTLTEREQEIYKKEDNKQRQKRFNANPENKAELNKYRKEHIAQKRKEEPEKYRANNVKDVRNFRLREQQMIEAINAKINAKSILTNAIKARKARQEMDLLKQQKQKQQDVKSILNQLIDTIPKKVQQKKNREAVARHKAKKAEGTATTYNLRSHK
jgi:hypothetical protein